MRRLLVLFYRLTLKSEEILQVKSSKCLSIIQLLNAVHAMYADHSAIQIKYILFT